MRLLTLGWTWIVMALSSAACAVEYHVAPAAGTASGAVLLEIRDTVRASGKLGTEPITIHLAAGIYYLPETLVFTATDSGTASAPVTWLGDPAGGTVISGGARLSLIWTPAKDGIWQATTPAGMTCDQLFINGVRQRMARYPNWIPDNTVAYNGFAADALERAAKSADPTGGYIHAMHRAEWGGYHYLITGKKTDGTLAFEGGWQNNRQMGMHNTKRMVEKLREELDAPLEWYHQTSTNTLFSIPAAGVDVNTAMVEIVRLPQLIALTGSAEAPVKGIILKNLTLRHAARTFMANKEPLLRSDWTICRSGAVIFTGTEDCALIDSHIDQPGGNAVFVNTYNRRVTIQGCHIHDVGATAVAFVGDSASVRNPLFEYGQKQKYADIDLTPGPKTDNYPRIAWSMTA